MIEQGVPMRKVAILATVWLHLVVLGLLVGGTESLRIRKLPVPDIGRLGQRLESVVSASVVHDGMPDARCGLHRATATLSR